MVTIYIKFSCSHCDGKGKIIYPDGKVYEREIFQWPKGGAGTLHCPNGKTYKNLWKNDQMDGIGTIEY